MHRTVLFVTLMTFTAALRADQSELDGRLRAAKKLMGQGNPVGAEQTLLTALKDTKMLPPGDVRTALVLNNLGAACNEQARFREATAYYRRALDSCGWDCNHVLMARFTANLANAYLAADDLTAAERIDLGSVINRMSTWIPQEVELARLLIASGELASRRGRLLEAEQCYRRALDVLKTTKRPDFETSVVLLHNLALLHMRMRQLDQAASYSERAFALASQKFPEADPVRALAATGLGTARLLAKQYDEAEQLYSTAFTIAERAFGPAHPVVGQVLSLHAILLDRTHQKGKAKQYRRRAELILANYQGTSGRKHVVDLQDLLREAKRR